MAEAEVVAEVAAVRLKPAASKAASVDATASESATAVEPAASESATAVEPATSASMKGAAASAASAASISADCGKREGSRHE
jgi:hypothetical protein